MPTTRCDAITRMAMAAVAAAVPRFQQARPARRQVTIDGRRVRTVDAHAHTFVPAVAAAVSGTELEKSVAGSLKGNLVMSDERLRAMDAQGIDVEVLSINPYWYGANREIAARLIQVQNEGLAALCEPKGGDRRFVALATVALSIPSSPPSSSTTRSSGTGCAASRWARASTAKSWRRPGSIRSGRRPNSSAP